MTSKPVTPQRSASAKPKVFIVHGREQLVKQEVARFVERIGLEAVILHERPNGGRTLIKKFEEESADITFAIVLITPDDTGGLAGGQQNPRARQNVIFELGFFIGKLGAAKVCALVQGNVEKPSDFDAVVYVQYDGAGAWKTELARELKHAKVPFDANALI
jgi:predicted nucleotide-binding protein